MKTPEARLRHYAKHFRVLEVDATFYALLSATVVQRWVQNTLAGRMARPVPLAVYDRTLRVLGDAIDRAKLGQD